MGTWLHGELRKNTERFAFARHPHHYGRAFWAGSALGSDRGIVCSGFGAAFSCIRQCPKLIAEKGGRDVGNSSRLTKLSVIGLLAVVDQGVGWWAKIHLKRHAVLWVVRPWLGWHLLYNSGAMLSLGSHRPGLVTAIGVIGTLVLAGLSLYSKKFGLPAALMAGGALGNLLNRLVLGHVIDYVQVWGWPGIFNLADVCLRLGVLWMVWVMWRQRTPRSPELSKIVTDPK